MNFIKNIRFGINENTSGKERSVTGKSLFGDKNLASSRIKLQKRKHRGKGFLFSKITFKKK